MTTTTPPDLGEILGAWRLAEASGRLLLTVAGCDAAEIRNAAAILATRTGARPEAYTAVLQELAGLVDNLQPAAVRLREIGADQ